jgi:hypothetical protein
VGVVTAFVGISIMDVGVTVAPVESVCGVPAPGVAVTIATLGVPDKAIAVWVAKPCTSVMEAGPNVGANNPSTGVLVTLGWEENGRTQDETTIATNTIMETTNAPRFILAIMHLLNLEQKFQ